MNERLEHDPDIDVQYYAQRALLLCLGPRWVHHVRYSRILGSGTLTSRDQVRTLLGGKKKVCLFIQLKSKF